MALCEYCKYEEDVVYCTTDSSDRHHSYSDRPSCRIICKDMDDNVEYRRLMWHKHGELHRLTGPADIMKFTDSPEDNSEEYYIEGEEYYSDKSFRAAAKLYLEKQNSSIFQIIIRFFKKVWHYFMS